MCVCVYMHVSGSIVGGGAIGVGIWVFLSLSISDSLCPFLCVCVYMLLCVLGELNLGVIFCLCVCWMNTIQGLWLTIWVLCFCWVWIFGFDS